MRCSTLGDDYIQLTIRVPTKLYEKVKELAREWGTNLKDTVLIILWDYFHGGE